MSRIGKKPVAVPSSVTATVPAQTVKMKGRRASCPSRFPRRSRSRRRRTASRSRRCDETKKARAMWGMSRTQIANLVERRHQGLLAHAGDPGRRLPRRHEGQGPAAAADRLQPRRDAQDPGGRRGEGGRRQAGNHHRSPASTSNSSGRSLPTSAPRGRRSPTRARASATRASTSSARKARRSKDRLSWPPNPVRSAQGSRPPLAQGAGLRAGAAVRAPLRRSTSMRR